MLFQSHLVSACIWSSSLKAAGRTCGIDLWSSLMNMLSLSCVQANKSKLFYLTGVLSWSSGRLLMTTWLQEMTLSCQETVQQITPVKLRPKNYQREAVVCVLYCSLQWPHFSCWTCLWSVPLVWIQIRALLLGHCISEDGPLSED